jgi:hypothetical protein
MTGLTTAWLTEIVVISYRATKNGSNQGTTSIPLPLPSQFAATFIIYGALGLLPDAASGFASAVGWGFVLATVLNLWQPVKTGTTPNVVQSGAKTASGNTAA